MRTLHDILHSPNEHIEDYSILLKNGVLVEGLLIQERVDKTQGTDGYNIYDIRTGHTKDGVEIYYCTIEPNVRVDWADSIATKQTLDFGEDGYLEIDYSDICPEDIEKWLMEKAIESAISNEIKEVSEDGLYELAQVSFHSACDKFKQEYPVAFDYEDIEDGELWYDTYRTIPILIMALLMA